MKIPKGLSEDINLQKNRQYNDLKKKDKQRSTKHYTENKRSSNMNLNKNVAVSWFLVLNNVEQPVSWFLVLNNVEQSASNGNSKAGIWKRWDTLENDGNYSCFCFFSKYLTILISMLMCHSNKFFFSHIMSTTYWWARGVKKVCLFINILIKIHHFNTAPEFTTGF